MYQEKKLLVVDDEIGFHALFRYLLEPRGYFVNCVSNGLADTP